MKCQELTRYAESPKLCIYGEICLSQVEGTYGKSPGQIYAMETMKLLEEQAGR